MGPCEGLKNILWYLILKTFSILEFLNVLQVN